MDRVHLSCFEQGTNFKVPGFKYLVATGQQEGSAGEGACCQAKWARV